MAYLNNGEKVFIFENNHERYDCEKFPVEILKKIFYVGEVANRNEKEEKYTIVVDDGNECTLPLYDYYTEDDRAFIIKPADYLRIVSDRIYHLSYKIEANKEIRRLLIKNFARKFDSARFVDGSIEFQNEKDNEYQSTKDSSELLKPGEEVLSFACTPDLDINLIDYVAKLAEYSIYIPVKVLSCNDYETGTPVYEVELTDCYDKKFVLYGKYASHFGERDERFFLRTHDYLMLILRKIEQLEKETKSLEEGVKRLNDMFSQLAVSLTYTKDYLPPQVDYYKNNFEDNNGNSKRK